MHTADAFGYSITIHHETTTIHTADELAIVLDVLHGQHDRAVLEQLRPHLAAILAGPAGCLQVMRVLSTDDRLFLVAALGRGLVPVLREARFLRELLATCGTGGVADAVFEAIGHDGLRDLVATAADLADVLEWVYGTTDRHMLRMLGPAHLQRLLRTGADMSLVLNALDLSGQTEFLDLVGWARVAGLVNTGRDLAALMRALPADLSARLLDQLSREALIAAIGNPRDWAYLYDRLEPAEAAILRQKMGVD